MTQIDTMEMVMSEQKWIQEAINEMERVKIHPESLSAIGYLQGYKSACRKRQEEIDLLKSATEPYYLASIENLRVEIEELKKIISMNLEIHKGDLLGASLNYQHIEERLGERDELIKEAIAYIDFYSRSSHYSLKQIEKKEWLEKAKRILGVGGSNE